MRWLVGLLVLANILVAGYFLLWRGEAGTAHVQIQDVGKIHILDFGTPPHAAGSKPKGGGPSADNAICMEWRGLSAAQMDQGRKAMQALASEHVLSVKEVPLQRMYWVMIPPLPSSAEATARLAQLRALGIADAALVTAAPWQNAISLGLYASEDAASRRLAELAQKGVSGLSTQTQAKAGTDYYFLIKSANSDVMQQLDGIRLAFPTTTLSRVACGDDTN